MIASHPIHVSHLRDIISLSGVESCHHKVDGVGYSVPPPQCYYLSAQRRAFTLSPTFRQNYVPTTASEKNSSEGEEL